MPYGDKSPQKSGFDRGNWTAKLVARRILNRFSVPYTNDGTLNLAHRLGFSVRKPRPIPYNSATPEEQRAFIENAKATVAKWGEAGRHVVVIVAATIQDSPSSKRGLRRRGGRDTVGINYSRKSANLLGALGNGTLHIEYHDNLKVDSYISLIDNVVKYGGRSDLQCKGHRRQRYDPLHQQHKRGCGDATLSAPYPAAESDRD